VAVRICLEATSEISEEHHEAGKLHKAKEVFDVVFPLCEQSTIVRHPGKEPFDFPAAAISARRTPALGLLLAVGPVRRDNLDAIFTHLLIQRIRVVGFVAD